MTQEILQITDFPGIENAIEAWVILGSGLPLIVKNSIPQAQAHWEGFATKRIRPYVLINSLPQPTQGQPWKVRSRVSESGTDKLNDVYNHPAKWNISFTFFTDAYDEDGKAIRQQAKFYAQQLVNRAYLPPVKSLLSVVNVSFNPLNQTPVPGVIEATDDDKYIHQATIDYRFEFVAQTGIKDSDFFETVTTPTETNGDLILHEA